MLTISLREGMVNAIDREHNHVECGAEVVESFIARAGDQDYHEGAWVLGVRMKDGPVWEAVKSGEINGFSVDALVRKSTQRVLVELTRIASEIQNQAKKQKTCQCINMCSMLNLETTAGLVLEQQMKYWDTPIRFPAQLSLTKLSSTLIDILWSNNA